MTNAQDQTPARTCSVCQRRTVERPLVCEICRDRLGHTLTDIAALYAQHVHPEPDAVDTWTVQQDRRDPEAARPRWLRALPDVDPGPNEAKWVPEDGCEPIAALLPAQAKSSNGGPRVTGSREAPVPVNVDAVDLTLPARVAGATMQAKQHPEDQIGHSSVPAILDSWVKDWRDLELFDSTLPLPTVPELVRWLGNRLQWAADRHHAIEEFAAEMGRLRAVLRGVLGLIDPQPEFCDGVVCRKCDRYALYRESDYVECDHCGLLYTDEEYREWTGLLAAQARKAAA